MNKKLILIIVPAAVIIAVAVVFYMNRGGSVVIQQPQVSALSADAKKMEEGGDLVSARAAYQKLINDYSNSREVMDWQKRFEDLNIRLLFSPVITSKSIEYEIKPGDSLDKIAREYKTTVELIMKSNNLSSENIFPGKKIKVWTAPFSIVVDKSQNTLILKSNEEVIKTYIVATGLNNSTPVGTFKIIEKIVNPPWYKPGGGMIPAGNPQNILGARWLGLDKEGYGIHGTTDPQSLGKQATAGCVRMLNAEVEQLYSIVPKGTEVTIVD
ncbi:MAG: L,D-transpeptidase family protein [Candidatus Omnitrophica bacterium]|nr:L,D-transpeptidase family protein [Candidatus Omnitrophota bacterium]